MLQKPESADIETTLIIHPFVLQSFDDYNTFVNVTSAYLEMSELEDVFQIAEFHPDYQFARTQTDDAQNYTNRSPYPMQHILRAESIERAVEGHPDIDAVPERNIRTMEEMGKEWIVSVLDEIKGNDQ